jgi:5-methylcytosine-specific restriction endonuclease McrA
MGIEEARSTELILGQNPKSFKHQVMPRNPKLRARLWQKQGFKCFWCGLVLRLCQTTIDHWAPKGKGGSEAEDNKVASCRFCNANKGHKNPWDWERSSVLRNRRRIVQAGLI